MTRGYRWLAMAGAVILFWLAVPRAARADEDLDTGVLLVADRKLQDPNFQKAVVLIINYGDQGTLGLVVNRPGDIPVSQLMSGSKAARDRKDTAYTGGPVEPKSVLALVRSSKSIDGGQRIAGDIWAIADDSKLADILSSHAGPDKLRFYVGYAGWGPGQLETEADAGAWRVIKASASTVFDAAPESLWDRVVRNLDQTLASATPSQRNAPQTAFFLRTPFSSFSTIWPAISRP